MKNTFWTFCKGMFIILKEKIIQMFKKQSNEEIKPKQQIENNQQKEQKPAEQPQQKSEEKQEEKQQQEQKNKNIVHLTLEDLNYLGWLQTQETENKKPNWVEAVKWFTLAAKLGSADAQCNLGICYHNGWGVQKDVNKAIELYTAAAEQGLAQAQNNLGSIYYAGEEVQKNVDEAIKWWLKAAISGDKYGLSNLQVCHYFDGKEEELQKLKQKVQNK